MKNEGLLADDKHLENNGKTAMAHLPGKTMFLMLFEDKAKRSVSNFYLST